jgi:hypothetical protein
LAQLIHVVKSTLELKEGTLKVAGLMHAFSTLIDSILNIPKAANTGTAAAIPVSVSAVAIFHFYLTNFA